MAYSASSALYDAPTRDETPFHGHTIVQRRRGCRQRILQRYCTWSSAGPEDEQHSWRCTETLSPFPPNQSAVCSQIRPQMVWRCCSHGRRDQRSAPAIKDCQQSSQKGCGRAESDPSLVRCIAVPASVLSRAYSHKTHEDAQRRTLLALTMAGRSGPFQRSRQLCCTASHIYKEFAHNIPHRRRIAHIHSIGSGLQCEIIELQ